MILFWGSKTITKAVGEGAFFCPQCRAHTSYSHLRVKEYFTLYFIPLFPTNTIGEFIECRECGTHFEPSIRDRSREQIELMLKPWKCSDCQCLNPPSEIRCLNCKGHRPKKEPADQPAPTAPANVGRDQGAFRATSPRATPKPPLAKTQSDLQDLAAILASNKCRECGVVNSLAALHCKGCGIKLGAS